MLQQKKKDIKLSHYQYKPDEIEIVAKEEYKKRLAKGETTSMAECRRVVQNLRVSKAKEGDLTRENVLAKEEMENLAGAGLACFNLKRFSKEEKDYAVVRWKKYLNDLGSKGIEIDAAPNDFTVRSIIELEIQIQREWSFIGALPLKDKTRVHNDAIKVLGNALRQMLDSLNALQKSAGRPEEAGGSISDLAKTMTDGKKDLKDASPKVDQQVDALRHKKDLKKNG